MVSVNEVYRFWEQANQVITGANKTEVLEARAWIVDLFDSETHRIDEIKGEIPFEREYLEWSAMGASVEAWEEIIHQMPEIDIQVAELALTSMSHRSAHRRFEPDCPLDEGYGYDLLQLVAGVANERSIPLIDLKDVIIAEQWGLGE